MEKDALKPGGFSNGHRAPALHYPGSGFGGVGEGREHRSNVHFAQSGPFGAVPNRYEAFEGGRGAAGDEHAYSGVNRVLFTAREWPNAVVLASQLGGQQHVRVNVPAGGLAHRPIASVAMYSNQVQTSAEVGQSAPVGVDDDAVNPVPPRRELSDNGRDKGALLQRLGAIGIELVTVLNDEDQREGTEDEGDGCLVAFPLASSRPFFFPSLAQGWQGGPAT